MTTQELADRALKQASTQELAMFHGILQTLWRMNYWNLTAKQAQGWLKDQVKSRLPGIPDECATNYALVIMALHLSRQ